MRPTAWIAAALIAGSVANATAAPVDVRIRSDESGWLPLYETVPVGAERRITQRFYAQARFGDHYTIEVRNNLARRVGLVIAVDGKNIISGQTSWLNNDERMYILEPFATGTFEGWRTDTSTTHRFFFTDPGQSYAAAFGDTSAMGVIALAAYPELPPPPVTARPLEDRLARQDAGAAPSAAPSARAMEKDSALGTGFGERQHSPARVVEFLPEHRPVARVLVKYETRESLCSKGIINCEWPRNRLWDDDGGFAPYPPGHRE